MPLMALIVTMPPLKKCWRYMTCHRCSVRRGSSPTTNPARSSTAPTTARVFHTTDASPQPTNPGSSVSTLIKIQLRIRALTTTVETARTFMSPSFPRDRLDLHQCGGPDFPSEPQSDLIVGSIVNPAVQARERGLLSPGSKLRRIVWKEVGQDLRGGAGGGAMT